jgi:2,4-dienoyl-CoA reductase-like NADH-dependent reductase (Old Yellow Enzyme family)
MAAHYTARAAGKVGATFIEQKEMTAPAAGGADTFRIFAQDNGAGKTQLMVQFATGSAIEIKIEA